MGLNLTDFADVGKKYKFYSRLCPADKSPGQYKLRSLMKNWKEKFILWH
jgi:hypothetical protein